MKIIDGNNCLDGWLNACKYIQTLPNQEDTNVLVNISNACDFTQLNDWVRRYDPRIIDKSFNSIRHVINTIMPYKLEGYFTSRFAFYKKYEIVFENSKAKKWGTYFQRLISFGKGFGDDHTNQLEKAIEALRSGNQQRFYITFHLTASNVESNVRPMGPPCWQFGELTINAAGGVDFVVVYRNHDYFNKAFGNFIGLAKLLEFICRESGRQSGALIVHSIHAFNDSGIRNFERLINA